MFAVCQRSREVGTKAAADANEGTRDMGKPRNALIMCDFGGIKDTEMLLLKVEGKRALNLDCCHGQPGGEKRLWFGF